MITAMPAAREEVHPGEAAGPAGGPGLGAQVVALVRHYRGPLSLTYGLLVVENALRLAQPVVLGLAIDGLLRSSAAGFVLLALQHLGHLAVSTARRAYDTRVFTRIYGEVAAGVVHRQGRRGAPLARVAALAVLSREFVDFLEQGLPTAVQAAFSLAGALAALAAYDGVLVAACAGLLVPAAVLARRFARRNRALSAGLHDQMEREVEVLAGGEPRGIREHYGLLRSWRIRLSDAEAAHFALLELFVFGLLSAALFRACSLPGAGPGDIVAVFQLVLLYVGGLDGLPLLVQQLARLHDVEQRTREESSLPRW
jgi:hypothetical protein